MVLASGRRDGAYFVTGLRDPLARDPRRSSPRANIAPGAVREPLGAYQALHPPFVLARAALLLRPPRGVSLTYEHGVLTATGAAPQQWIVETERLAPAIAGVRQFAFDRRERAKHGSWPRSKRRPYRICKRPIGDRCSDAAAGAPAGGGVCGELDDTVLARNRRAHVEVLGHTDSDGPDSLNVR